MREEEKLARDVYQQLFGLWSLPVFSNIAKAEQQHMDAVLNLLNTYNLTDPVADNPTGIFTNSALQQLHNDLMIQGAASALSALEVGILIEETDIRDLITATSNTANANIQRVYSNLLKGSNNHLAAFTSNLEALGGSANGDSQAQNLGLSRYDPISQTLYIPAVDASLSSGEKVVYDLTLKMVETLPPTLEVVLANKTVKLPNPELHASFDETTGKLLIADMVVGALLIEDVDNTHYSVELQVIPSANTSLLVVVNEIIMK
jgi:hypothetical protein